MGETIAIVAISAVVWWTFAVAALAIILNSERLGWTSIGWAVCWPIIAVLMVFVMPYQLAVKSTKAIRVDIYNRKLMKEFEEFLSQKRGKISEKDDAK